MEIIELLDLYGLYLDIIGVLMIGLPDLPSRWQDPVYRLTPGMRKLRLYLDDIESKGKNREEIAVSEVKSQAEEIFAEISKHPDQRLIVDLNDVDRIESEGNGRSLTFWSDGPDGRSQGSGVILRKLLREVCGYWYRTVGFVVVMLGFSLQMVSNI